MGRDKKSKKSKKHQKKASSSSSSASGDKGGSLCGLIFFLIAVGAYLGNEQVQQAVTANIGLANYAKDNCNELDWDELISSPETYHDDGCYYWHSDFRIAQDIGDGNMDNPIFNEAYQTRAIKFHREIHQYQMWEEEHCESHKRFGGVENSTFIISNKDKWSDEEKTRYADVKAKVDQQAKSDCYVEIHEGWNTQESWYNHNDDQQYQFAFPEPGTPSNNGGHREIWNSAEALVMVQHPAPVASNQLDLTTYDGAAIHYDFDAHSDTIRLAKIGANGLVMEHAGGGKRRYLDFVEGMGQTEFYIDSHREDRRKSADEDYYPDWDGETEEAVPSFPLCLKSGTIADNWSLEDTSSFVAHTEYGDEYHYPSCGWNDNEIQLGDYKFTAWVQGFEHSSNFVMATLKENQDGLLVAEPFKSPIFEDTSELLETALFLYQTFEDDKDVHFYLDNHIEALKVGGETMQSILYFIGGVAFVLSILCFKGAKESSSSSN